MYARRGLGAFTTEGAAVGTAVAGPLGTVAGGLLGSLFGGARTYPTQTLTVNTPGGPLQIVFSGAGAVQGSAQYIFTQWATQGHFDWLASIANTGSGPKWDNPSVTYTGYGQTDRNFAAQLVQAYQRATDPTTGAALVPTGTAVVAYQPAGAVRPAGAPATAAAGFSPLLGLGIGAAAIAAVFAMTGSRRAATHRLHNPKRRHTRRTRRRGRRRRR